MKRTVVALLISEVLACCHSKCDAANRSALRLGYPVSFQSDLSVFSDSLGEHFHQLFAFCRTIQFEKNHQQFIYVFLVHRFPAQITPFLILYGHYAHLKISLSFTAVWESATDR
jgi:hypothetical protein